MKAIIYARESEEDNRNKSKSKNFITTSIKNQESDGRETAKRFGDEIINVFKDVNVESTESTRKGFTNMLSYVRTLLPIKIYIKDYTRLGRFTTFFELRDKLVRTGVKKEHIFFWNEPHNNGISFEKDSMIMIKITAQYMSVEKNRDEYFYLINRKIQERKPIGMSPPYGYKWKNKDWVIVDRKKSTVIKTFNNLLKDVNYKITCKDLKITKGLYYRILNNYKSYYGILEFDIPERDSSNKIIGSKRITYECDYEKILDAETYQKIQEKLQSR